MIKVTLLLNSSPSHLLTIGVNNSSVDDIDLNCYNITSDDDGDNNDNDNEEINNVKKLLGFEGYDHDEDFEETSSKSAFSKWFMFLEDYLQKKNSKNLNKA